MVSGRRSASGSVAVTGSPKVLSGYGVLLHLSGCAGYPDAFRVLEYRGLVVE